MTVQQAPKHSVGRIIARFLSGRCMDGIRRTDATFLHHASRDITVHERAPKWCWLPGWQRALKRMLSLACACLAVYAWFYHRIALYQAGITVFAVLLVIEIYRIRKLAIMWSHRRKIIYPLWHILAEITGYAMPNPGRFQSIPSLFAGGPNYAKRDRPEKFLTIPRDYDSDEKTVVKFELPYTWEANTREQARVSQLISRHLGGDWAATWSLKTSPRFVALCHQPRPPERVSLADFICHMNASLDSVLCLGIGANGEIVGINLDSEAPHIAISAGTGGGKTDTVALIIAQLVRKGCERVEIIDPKRISHQHARGLPGVTIHRYVQGQMNAIHNMRILMDSRYDAMETDDNQVFSRRVLIIEEQNSLINDLKQYWDDYRRELSSEERGKAPRVNPAIADLEYILAKGRQCRINVISVYQRMSAKAAGNGDMRENYGCKILARYSPQTWKILIGTTPVPRPSGVPGRAICVIGDEHREVQRAYTAIAKPDGSADIEGIQRLRAFALNGKPDTDIPASYATVTSEPVTAVPKPVNDLLSLREISESALITVKYAALRKAKQRDSEFPKPMGNCYRLTDIVAWQANRVRAKVAA